MQLDIGDSIWTAFDLAKREDGGAGEKTCPLLCFLHWGAVPGAEQIPDQNKTKTTMTAADMTKNGTGVALFAPLP